MNSWSFTGNLGKDCESRFTPNGDAVVQFSVAVKSGYGEKEAKTWVRCAIWGKRGELVAKYLTKGQLVGIIGEATLREFTNKEGSKQSSLEVRVNDLTLLGKKSDDSASTPAQNRAPSANSPAAGAHPAGGLGDFEDDIPF